MVPTILKEAVTVKQFLCVAIVSVYAANGTVATVAFSDAGVRMIAYFTVIPVAPINLVG